MNSSDHLPQLPPSDSKTNSESDSLNATFDLLDALPNPDQKEDDWVVNPDPNRGPFHPFMPNLLSAPDVLSGLEHIIPTLNITSASQYYWYTRTCIDMDDWEEKQNEEKEQKYPDE